MVFKFCASDHKLGEDSPVTEALEFRSRIHAKAFARDLCSIWGCQYVWLQEGDDCPREQVFPGEGE